MIHFLTAVVVVSLRLKQEFCCLKDVHLFTKKSSEKQLHDDENN